MHLSLRRRTAVTLAAALTAATVAPPRAVALQFVVNTAEDAVSAVPDRFCDVDPITPDDQCTLREAIMEANAAPGLDQIRFADRQFEGPVVLDIPPTLGDADTTGREGDLDIVGDLLIEGLGNTTPGNPTTPKDPSAVVIDASALGDRVFQTADGVASNLELKNFTIVGGTANRADDGNDCNGGALHQTAGTLVLTTMVLRDNVGTDGSFCGDGGAVYLGDVDATIQGHESDEDDNITVFEGNLGTRGGAIHGDLADITISDTHFIDNESNFIAGAIEVDGGSLLVRDSEFRGNTATAGRSASRGGAIELEVHREGGQPAGDDPTADGTFIDVDFIDNAASLAGGAILDRGQEGLVIRGGRFEGNAGSTGGAISVETQSELLVEPSDVGRTVFTGNTSTSGHGGAVASAVQATITDADFTSNTSGNSGGAVQLRGDDSMITGSTFTTNTAPSINGRGGAVAIADAAAAALTNNTFTGNTATFEGGAVHLDQSGTTATLTGNTYVGNVATGNVDPARDGHGGAVFAGTTGTVVVDDETFDTATPNVAAFGAAIAGSRALLEVRNLTIADHTADAGGAVHLRAGSSTISDVVLAGNTATTGAGGALLLVPDTRFDPDTTGSVTITRSTVRDNQAARDGGGIAVDRGTLTLTATPTARLDAGDLDGGVVVTGNAAGRNGGGIAVTSDPADGDTPDLLGIATIAGATIGGADASTNTAVAGGGLWVGDDEDVTVTSSLLDGNTATTAGGGVRAGGSTTIDDSLLTDNRAPVGTAAQVDGSLRLRSSVVSDHAVAADASTVNIGATGSLGTQNVTIVDNDAGVASLIDGAGQVTVRATTVSRNAAAAVVRGELDLLVGGAVLDHATTVCDVTGAVSSDGGSVTTDDTCGLVGDGDVVADPELEPFELDGLLGVFPLRAGTPPVDRAVACLDLDGGALTVDQRGDTRPTNGDETPENTCDAGAVELQRGVLITPVADAAEASPTSIPGSFLVTRVGVEPVGPRTVPVTILVDGEVPDGSQLVDPPTEVAFGDGERQVLLELVPVDDDVAEPTRTISARLSDAPATDVEPVLPASEDAAEIRLLDDDTVVAITATGDGAEAGAVAATFEVTRNGITAGDLVVDLEPRLDAPDSVTIEDLGAVPTSVTIPDGQSTATVTIPVTDDDLLEGRETLTLAVLPTDPPSFTIDGSGSATADVVDDEQLVSIRTITDAGEPARDGLVRISRAVNLDGAVVVAISSTPEAGQVQPLPTSVTIPDGVASVDLPIQVIDDDDPDGTFPLDITVEPGTYDVDPDAGTTRVLVLDDEQQTVRITAPDGDAAEPADGATLVLERSAVNDPVTVTLGFTGSATNGDDLSSEGAAIPMTYAFPGTDRTIQIDVDVIDDLVWEGTEELVVTIEPDAGYAVAGGPATITVLDDDVTIAVDTEGAGDGDAAEPATSGMLRFTRSGNDLSTPVDDVPYAVTGTATPTDDYVPLSGTVSFPADTTEVLVPVMVTDDLVPEVAETVVVTLEDGEAPVDQTPAIVTITDDDTQLAIVADDADAAEPADDGGVVITRTGGDQTQALVVDLLVGGTADNGVDVEAIPAQVTIEADASSVVVPVLVLDDDDVEGDETVVVTVAPNAAYTTPGAAEATVTVADDDVELTLTAPDPDAEEPVDDGAFLITRTGAVDQPEVVTYTVSGTADNGTDYETLSGSVQFAADQTQATIPVRTLDDQVAEGGTVGTESVVLTVEDQSATVTIQDDDIAVAVVATDDDAAEPDDDGQLTLTRTGDQRPAVEVALARSGNAGDGDVRPLNDDDADPRDVVTIPAGSSSLTVDVKVVDDLVVEDEETVTYTVLPSATVQAGTPSSATVTIADDDRAVSIRASVARAAEPGTDGEFTVSRTGRTDEPLTIGLSASGTATADDDHDRPPSAVTFDTGVRTVVVPLVVRDDDVVEQDETVVLTIDESDEHTIVGPASATVTIVSDDEASTGGDEENPTEGDEELTPPVIRRLEGASRIDTAVAVAQSTFPDGTATVVLARADDYPDALAGGPLAHALDAPILLTSSEALDAATATELRRLAPTTVVLLGGEVALAAAVEDDVRALGVATTRRVAGDDRFATAAAIADELLATIGTTTAPDVYLTEGTNPDPARGWPDAVSVAPLAAHQARPILLTSTATLPTATTAALDDLQAERVVVAGGPVAVSDGVVAQAAATGASVTRVFGDTRYETSRAVADLAIQAGLSPSSTWFATGRNFADALVGGPAVAADGGILLLLDGTSLAGSPPAQVWLEEFASDIRRVTLLGGPVAIDPSVRSDIEARLGAR